MEKPQKTLRTLFFDTPGKQKQIILTRIRLRQGKASGFALIATTRQVAATSFHGLHGLQFRSPGGEEILILLITLNKNRCRHHTVNSVIVLTIILKLDIADA